MDNYSTPPTNTPPTPTENHFVAIDFDNPESPNPKQPKNRRGILIAIIAVVVIVATISGAALLLVTPRNCFEANNYTDLVILAQDLESGDGLVLSDVSQYQELFTQSVYFVGDTAEIDLENSDEAPKLFEALGIYTKDHQEKAPIAITIESNYFAGSSAEIAQQRLSAIKDKLVKAGVDASAIVAKEPAAITIDEDSMYDEDVIDGMPVGILVTPVSRCEE